MLTFHSDFKALLEEAAPATLLGLGQRAGQVLAAYCAEVGTGQLTVLDHPAEMERLEAGARFDLVFVAGILERLPKGEALNLIARLRDCHAGRLYVLVPMGKAWLGHESFWEQNELLGLGMQRVDVYAENGWPLHLYQFDLHTYKTTPEWLNSKYWAHPELWDRY